MAGAVVVQGFCLAHFLGLAVRLQMHQSFLGFWLVSLYLYLRWKQLNGRWFGAGLFPWALMSSLMMFCALNNAYRLTEHLDDVGGLYWVLSMLFALQASAAVAAWICGQLLEGAKSTVQP